MKRKTEVRKMQHVISYQSYHVLNNCLHEKTDSTEVRWSATVKREDKGKIPLPSNDDYVKITTNSKSESIV